MQEKFIALYVLYIQLQISHRSFDAVVIEIKSARIRYQPKQNIGLVLYFEIGKTFADRSDCFTP